MTEKHLPLEVGLALACVDAELRRQFDARMSAHGISRTDFSLLAALDRAPQRSLRRIDLAGRVGLTASGVTRLLAPLERIGLVDRRANVGDARVALAVLTAAGERLVREATETAADTAGDLIGARLSDDELATLHALLRRFDPAASRPTGELIEE